MTSLPSVFMATQWLSYQHGEEAIQKSQRRGLWPHLTQTVGTRIARTDPECLTPATLSVFSGPALLQG